MNRQHGFSLIELMIALVLGLMVSGAVLQIFVMNNRSIVVQRAAIITQDQGRVALDMMARYIRMAGYQELDLAGTNLIDGLDGTENGGADSITVRYQAGNDMSASLYDCVGTEYSTASSGDISVSEFKLESSGAGMFNLICDNGTVSGALASNIEQFNVLYGVDTSDADVAPNRYISATAVSNSSESMADVVAVKVCLIIASDNNMLDTDTVFDDYCVTGTPAVTDRRIRRKVGSTITLRNRAGGSV